MAQLKCSNDGNVQKIAYLWDIENIGDYDFQPGEYITSSRFFASAEPFKSGWKLHFYPGGKEEDSADKMWIVLVVDNAYGKEYITVKPSCSIVNSNREVLEKCERNGNCEDVEISATDVGSLKKELEFRLIKEDPQWKWVTHEGTLSILFELDVYVMNAEKAIHSLNVQRLMSKSLIQKENTSINVIVAKTEQTAIVPYGQVSLEVKYLNLGAGNVGVTVAKHPEVKHIWCSMLLISNNSPVACFDGKLYAGKQHILANVNNCQNINLDFAIKFLAIAPKDSFVYDFSTAANRLKMDLQNLFVEPKFGDVSISVDGKTLRAHKDLLVARSPVFAAMFEKDVLVSNSNAVTITAISYECVHAMLKYIYYGMTEHEGVDVLELFKAAAKYGLTILQNGCEKVLCDSIDMDNFMSFMLLADQYYAPMLKNTVISFMRNAPYMQYN